MKYIILEINTKPEIFLFLYEYTTEDTRLMLGELIKVSNICYLKGYSFDFIQIMEDPNLILSKDDVYIYNYKQIQQYHLL